VAIQAAPVALLAVVELAVLAELARNRLKSNIKSPPIQNLSIGYCSKMFILSINSQNMPKAFYFIVLLASRRQKGQYIRR